MINSRPALETQSAVRPASADNALALNHVPSLPDHSLPVTLRTLDPCRTGASDIALFARGTLALRSCRRSDVARAGSAEDAPLGRAAPPPALPAHFFISGVGSLEPPARIPSPLVRQLGQTRIAGGWPALALDFAPRLPWRRCRHCPNGPHGRRQCQGGWRSWSCPSLRKDSLRKDSLSQNSLSPNGPS